MYIYNKIKHSFFLTKSDHQKKKKKSHVTHELYQNICRNKWTILDLLI